MAYVLYLHIPLPKINQNANKHIEHDFYVFLLIFTSNTNTPFFNTQRTHTDAPIGCSQCQASRWQNALDLFVSKIFLSKDEAPNVVAYTVPWWFSFFFLLKMNTLGIQSYA